MLGLQSVNRTWSVSKTGFALGDSPSNWPILSQSFTSPRTALNWGWLTHVTNQRVTLGYGWRNEGSRTCRWQQAQGDHTGKRTPGKQWQQHCCFNRRLSMSNLLVEPEHRASHSDVSQADSLSHQEGAGVQVLVQQCEGLLHIFLGLLCRLERPRDLRLLQRWHLLHEG